VSKAAKARQYARLLEEERLAMEATRQARRAQGAY